MDCSGESVTASHQAQEGAALSRLSNYSHPEKCFNLHVSTHLHHTQPGESSMNLYYSSSSLHHHTTDCLYTYYSGHLVQYESALRPILAFLRDNTHGLSWTVGRCTHQSSFANGEWRAVRKTLRASASGQCGAVRITLRAHHMDQSINVSR